MNRLNGAHHFYGLSYLHDSLSNGVYYLDLNWQTPGMVTCAVQLYNNLQGQKLYSDNTDVRCTTDFHACSVRDDATPQDINGKVLYREAWLYLCGK